MRRYSEADASLEFARHSSSRGGTGSGWLGIGYVDGEQFARVITQALDGHPNIPIVRDEVTEVPPDAVSIIATGPLTSERFSKAISELTHAHHLYFFDAISPLRIDADSINIGGGLSSVPLWQRRSGLQLPHGRNDLQCVV